MADGVGITLPRPGYGQDPYQVYLDKCIVATPLAGIHTSNDDSTDWDILINAGDADTETNIPLFSLPSGALVLDVGVQVISAQTDAAVYVVGDFLDSDGWLNSDMFAGSDESLDIKWASKMGVDKLRDFIFAFVADTAWLDAGDSTDNDTGILATDLFLDTATPGYGTRGGKIGVYDTSGTSTGEEYIIFMHQKSAVDIIGVTAFWIKYSLASLNIPIAISSDLGTTGD